MHNHPILRLPVYWHASDVGPPLYGNGRSWVEASEIQETQDQLHRQNWAMRRWFKNGDCHPSWKGSCARKMCSKWKTRTRHEIHTVLQWETAASSVGGRRWGHAVVQLVETLRYKLEGCGFDSRWCHWNFLLKWTSRPHFGIDSASSWNKSRECFLGGGERVKTAGA